MVNVIVSVWLSKTLETLVLLLFLFSSPGRGALILSTNEFKNEKNVGPIFFAAREPRRAGK